METENLGDVVFIHRDPGVVKVRDVLRRRRLTPILLRWPDIRVILDHAWSYVTEGFVRRDSRVPILIEALDVATAAYKVVAARHLIPRNSMAAFRKNPFREEESLTAFVRAFVERIVFCLGQYRVRASGESWSLASQVPFNHWVWSHWHERFVVDLDPELRPDAALEAFTDYIFPRGHWYLLTEQVPTWLRSARGSGVC